MSTLRNGLYGLLTLAMIGCSAGDVPVDDPDDPTVDTDDPAQTAAMKIDGTWELESAFDLTSNLQGSVGTPIKDFLSAFDEPTDPIGFLLDLIVDQIAGTDESSVRTAITGPIEIALVAAIQTALPSEYEKITTFGRDSNTLVKRFGLKTRVTITGDKALVTVVALTARFEGDETATVMPMDEIGMDEIVIENVPVVRDSAGKVVIGEITVNLPFGSLVLAVVDSILIPTLEPALSTTPGNLLGPFLARIVRCTDVDGKPSIGTLLAEELGSGYDWVKILVNGACSIGLNIAATYLIEQLDSEGAGLTFKMTGTARPVDMDSNGTADKLQAGNWAGTVTLGEASSPLAAESPFLGVRPTAAKIR